MSRPYATTTPSSTPAVSSARWSSTTSIPSSVAASLTGLGDVAEPLPRRRSGRVTTTATSSPAATSASQRPDGQLGRPEVRRAGDQAVTGGRSRARRHRMPLIQPSGTMAAWPRWTSPGRPPTSSGTRSPPTPPMGCPGATRPPSPRRSPSSSASRQPARLSTPSACAPPTRTGRPATATPRPGSRWCRTIRSAGRATSSTPPTPWPRAPPRRPRWLAASCPRPRPR